MNRTQRRSPAAGDDRARNNIAVAANDSEINTLIHDFQTLGACAGEVVIDLAGRRVAYLARRCGIAPETAKGLAPFVFGDREGA
jgi:hypothetical protein